MLVGRFGPVERTGPKEMALDLDRLRSLGLSEIEFVAFDTETAVHAPLDRVVEIGGVKFQGGEVKAEFSTLVDPSSPISEAGTAVHGITDAMVRGAPKAKEAIGSFLAFAGDAVLVAHHAPFDAGVLAGEMAREGIAPPGNPILDTRLLARATVKFDSYGLENLVKSLGLPAELHHRALPDSRHVFRLMRRLVAEPRETSMAEVLRRNGPPISFERYVPQAPALPDELLPLKAAASSGEPLTIVYAGEGSPAAPRVVTPKLLFLKDGVGYLEAFCHQSGFVKTYRLDRIRGLRTEVERGLFDF